MPSFLLFELCAPHAKGIWSPKFTFQMLLKVWHFKCRNAICSFMAIFQIFLCAPRGKISSLMRCQHVAKAMGRKNVDMGNIGWVSETQRVAPPPPSRLLIERPQSPHNVSSRLFDQLGGGCLGPFLCDLRLFNVLVCFVFALLASQGMGLKPSFQNFWQYHCDCFNF